MVYLAGMDPSIMKVVDEDSFHATCEGFVEKRKGRMMGIVDRAIRTKCEFNLIGVACSEMSPLARMMGSND